MARREDIRQVEGTPPFQFKNVEIAASGLWIIDLETDHSLTPKYLPMDFVEITNDSGSDIQIAINQDPNFIVFVAAGVIKKVSDLYFSTLGITNLDAVNAIPANKIMVNVARSRIDADKAAYKKAKRYGLLGQILG